MREVPITRGFVALVDDEDYDKANRFKWYPIKSGNNYYATAYNKSDKKYIRLHWLIIGKPPKGMVVDHKDGNGLNNQSDNLRFCTADQNHCNRKSWGKSNFLGVFPRKGRTYNPWQAKIGSTHLGVFKTEDNAATAYNFAARARYGEFARINN